jgi:hypothetical protein
MWSTVKLHRHWRRRQYSLSKLDNYLPNDTVSQWQKTWLSTVTAEGTSDSWLRAVTSLDSRTWPRLARAQCAAVTPAGCTWTGQSCRPPIMPFSTSPRHCALRTTNTANEVWGLQDKTAFWSMTPCRYNFSQKLPVLINNPPWGRIQHIPPNYKTTRNNLLIWVWNMVSHIDGKT